MSQYDATLLAKVHSHFNLDYLPIDRLLHQAGHEDALAVLQAPMFDVLSLDSFRLFDVGRGHYL